MNSVGSLAFLLDYLEGSILHVIELLSWSIGSDITVLDVNQIAKLVLDGIATFPIVELCHELYACFHFHFISYVDSAQDKIVDNISALIRLDSAT